MNKISKIFQPLSIVPQNALVKNQNITSNSQKLMLELGLIKSTSNGSYHMLPLLEKSIQKCIDIIDNELGKINCQKIIMPLLTSAALWKKTGRYTSTENEIMTSNDRHSKLQILSPTHEESVTALLGSIAPISYKQFPLRLYQIGVKFRDELKPRFGLIRGREFLMKDLYTFDINREEAINSFNEVNASYDNIFKRIGVPFVKVKADTGMMGGSLSYEYHYSAKIGEDRLVSCFTCNYASNMELNETRNCSICDNTNLNETQGIEIGHTFLLDDRYSKALGATTLLSNNKVTPLIMGSYGIGVSRIIPSAMEVLSNENELRWPFALVPYKLIIIPPKDGSKEEENSKMLVDKLYNAINKIFENDVVIDDRTSLTIGKRLFDAKRMGYPMIVVIGAKSVGDNPKFELIEENVNKAYLLEYSELMDKVKCILKEKVNC